MWRVGAAVAHWFLLREALVLRTALSANLHRRGAGAGRANARRLREANRDPNRMGHKWGLVERWSRRRKTMLPQDQRFFKSGIGVTLPAILEKRCATMGSDLWILDFLLARCHRCSQLLFLSGSFHRSIYPQLTVR